MNPESSEVLSIEEIAQKLGISEDEAKKLAVLNPKELKARLERVDAPPKLAVVRAPKEEIETAFHEVPVHALAPKKKKKGHGQKARLKALDRDIALIKLAIVREKQAIAELLIEQNVRFHWLFFLFVGWWLWLPALVFEPKRVRKALGWW
jgi:hypothetical protein